MNSFLKIAHGIDMLPLQLALQKKPHLWGQHGARKYAEASPHLAMTDIWVRYNHIDNLGPNFNDEHDSVWYPAINDLPQVRPIVMGLMARVEGERLGGVLITKIPPGGSIAPHVDGGWHAGYYEKYYVAVKNDPGAVFGFPDGDIHANTGDVYWFRNDIPHWVNNDSSDERIAMIACIK
jgi:hypothetical protein